MIPSKLAVAVLRSAAVVAGSIVLTLANAGVYAQLKPGDSRPTNDLPDPYRNVSDWAKLPDGMKWGAVTSVQFDKKGNIWIFQRCGSDTCVNTTEDPIIELDKAGKYLRSFGSGMFVSPHGLTIDRDGNLWAADFMAKDGKGMQVYKFNPEGKLLMTLGKAGVAGPGPDEFQPIAVAISPKGDIFLADGHGQPGSNNRIIKMTSDGKFIKQWGTTGSGPGQFNGPHSLTFDRKGRLLVADRGNNRIEIFDQDGNYITEWKQFGRPGGVYVDPKNILYVSDSDSNVKSNPGWQRGIRIGSASDGTVKYFIPDPNTDPNFLTTSAAEGVGADQDGNVYGAEVAGRALKKYVTKQ
jgi:streptogramin lyase